MVRFRNRDANIKDEMLELFQAINQRELNGGGGKLICISIFISGNFAMSDRFHVASIC